MKTIIFLALCLILPALTVACTLGLHNHPAVRSVTARL